MSNEKGATLPRRNRTPEIQAEGANEAQKAIINSAPLHTSANHQTNLIDLDHDEPKVKPWREGSNMSPDELKSVTEKVSYNLPMETLMKLEFLLQNDKKNRVLGKKTNKTTLVVEALEEYTNKRLKKLGFDVND